MEQELSGSEIWQQFEHAEKLSRELGSLKAAVQGFENKQKELDELALVYLMAGQMRW